MKVLIVLTFVALAAASGDYGKKDDYSHGSYTYHGKYGGKCANDGLYYNDEKSFVFCSNGHSYEQPCAPGSRNSGYGKYSYGGKYSYRDFCDVNLVDIGYAAKHQSYGYDNKHDAGYGHDRRDVGYGRRDYGYGRRDYGYGRFDRGYGYDW